MIYGLFFGLIDQLIEKNEMTLITKLKEIENEMIKFGPMNLIVGLNLVGLAIKYDDPTGIAIGSSVAGLGAYHSGKRIYYIVTGKFNENGK